MSLSQYLDSLNENPRQETPEPCCAYCGEPGPNCVVLGAPFHSTCQKPFALEYDHAFSETVQTVQNTTQFIPLSDVTLDAWFTANGVPMKSVSMQMGMWP